MRTIIAITLACFLSACASYSLTDANGNKVSGSMMNGAASVSSGAACAPAVPSPSATPPSTSPPPAMQAKMVCDSQGQHCQAMMMALAADNAPVCNTIVANVRGTDLTTLFQWAMAGAGIGFLLAK